MAGELESLPMAGGRGLLTEKEREAIAGESSGSYHYKTRSFFRNRLQELSQDIETLEEHDQELLAELQEIVCGEE